MLHTGMDVHKRYSVITVMDDVGREVVARTRVTNEDEEVRSFFTGFEEELGVVLEAGRNWHWMCDLLDEMGIPNRLCHPLKTKAIASAKIKTDKIDSGILAHLGRMDFVPESYKPDMATRHLRELLRFRASLVKARANIKNRVHSLLAKLNIRHQYSDLFGRKGKAFLAALDLARVYRDALDGYLSVIERLDREIKRADGLVDDKCTCDQEAGLLLTMPGVGPILALTILAEIGNVNRFRSGRHLASYAGLVPSTSQSGESVRHGHITHQGSSWLRWALVEVSIRVVTYPGPLKSYYLNLKKKKGNKIARVAVARKLATYIYYMLKEGEDFSCVTDQNASDRG